MIDPEILRAIPKVELHCHLEGSIRPSTLIELATSHGLALPSTDPDVLYSYDDLTDFLVVYEIACAAMATTADFARATYESLEDAATLGNVRYREMFFNPTLHPGLSYRQMIDGIVDGIRAAETDHGIVTRLIPSIYRQDSVATAAEMVEAMISYRPDEVIGLGMDGDELTDPPEKFAEVFALARSSGLRATAHVAHDGPASFITTCLELLECERVDHGYHIVDEPEMMAELAETHMPFLCATGTPPLCGWEITENQSPIKTMIEAGLKVVINSDDPAMFHTDLSEEFIKICNGWDLPPSRVRQFVVDAIDASWMDAEEKRTMASELIREMDPLLAMAGPS